MEEFLAASEVIDWRTEAVLRLARQLADGALSPTETAERSFAWVRDRIQHSLDHGRSELTCRATDVLQAGTGFCYAKSHLLAALLRANGIPTGFCYQRLSLDGDGPPYCLHGLNAVHLPDHGWYRIDPRGNRGSDLIAEFSPPEEHLPFAADGPGEAMLPEIHSDPLPAVVAVLTRCKDVAEAARNLPDVDRVSEPKQNE